MGIGWRIMTERVRQTMHLGQEKGFQTTTNARNEAMMVEAGEFANHLKRCEKDIRTLKQASEGLLNTTKVVLSAPLPRVYELGEGGKAIPIAPAPETSGIIGSDFHGDELTRSSKETSKKLDSEVLAPMQRWTTAYQTVQSRMKRLEGIRLEVDSRQRTVNQLTTNLNRQRAGLSTNPTQMKSKSEISMDQTMRKLSNKDNKLIASRQSFKEQEALVFQQLAQLIKDAVWLKSYLSAVLKLEQEAFTQAFHAMGTQKAAAMLHSGPSMDMGAQRANDGMIPAARPGDKTGANMAHLNMNNKIAMGKRLLPGKENGSLASPGKAYSMERLPPAPTHPISVRRQESPVYNRYSTNEFSVMS